MNSSMHVWCLMCAFGMQRVVWKYAFCNTVIYGPHMEHCAVVEESSFCFLPSGFLLKILFCLTRCVYLRPAFRAYFAGNVAA
jgi:hypothetical protein